MKFVYYLAFKLVVRKRKIYNSSQFERLIRSHSKVDNLYRKDRKYYLRKLSKTFEKNIKEVKTNASNIKKIK